MNKCKEAIKELISNLNYDNLIHLVIYDDKVDTLFSNKKITDMDYMIECRFN
jgi:hypothetical protein